MSRIDPQQHRWSNYVDRLLKWTTLAVRIGALIVALMHLLLR